VRRARRGGFALADFVAGMLILAGALTAFTTMTKAKVDLLAAGDQHQRALAAAEEALDRVRTGGLPARPSGPADPDGFRKVVAFAPKADLYDPSRTLPGVEGLVEARALRADGDAHGLYEVRVTVRWRDSASSWARVSLSTVAEAP
jgi:hypothetical protein